MLKNRPEDISQARIYWEEALAADISEDATRPQHANFQTLNLQMPISLLMHDLISQDVSKKFIEEEIEIFRDAGHSKISDFYQSLVTETHTGVPPIVCGAYLIDSNIRIHIWDGWHRSSAANATQKQAIDAIIVYCPSLQKQLNTEIAAHNARHSVTDKKVA